jgi:hypothetical protein
MPEQYIDIEMNTDIPIGTTTDTSGSTIIRSGAFLWNLISKLLPRARTPQEQAQLRTDMVNGLAEKYAEIKFPGLRDRDPESFTGAVAMLQAQATADYNRAVQQYNWSSVHPTEPVENNPWMDPATKAQIVAYKQRLKGTPGDGSGGTGQDDRIITDPGDGQGVPAEEWRSWTDEERQRYLETGSRNPAGQQDGTTGGTTPPEVSEVGLEDVTDRDKLQQWIDQEKAKGGTVETLWNRFLKAFIDGNLNPGIKLGDGVALIVGDSSNNNPDIGGTSGGGTGDGDGGSGGGTGSGDGTGGGSGDNGGGTGDGGGGGDGGQSFEGFTVPRTDTGGGGGGTNIFDPYIGEPTNDVVSVLVTGGTDGGGGGGSGDGGGGGGNSGGTGGDGDGGGGDGGNEGDNGGGGGTGAGDDGGDGTGSDGTGGGGGGGDGGTGGGGTPPATDPFDWTKFLDALKGLGGPDKSSASMETGHPGAGVAQPVTTTLDTKPSAVSLMGQEKEAIPSLSDLLSSAFSWRGALSR